MEKRLLDMWLGLSECMETTEQTDRRTPSTGLRHPSYSHCRNGYTTGYVGIQTGVSLLTGNSVIPLVTLVFRLE